MRPGFIRLERSFFARPVLQVAPDLLGKLFIVDGEIGGLITETEAYDGAVDPAAHCFGGRTPRCKSMFERGGTFYVYRIHQEHCCNTVTGDENQGAGVLIRGIKATHGIDVIRSRRGKQSPKNWTNGPGKITRALKIDLKDDGIDLCSEKSRVQVFDCGLKDVEFTRTPRIGISKAKELLWRFVVDPATIDLPNS